MPRRLLNALGGLAGVLLVLVLTSPAPARAQGPGAGPLNLYAVPGLFGPESSNCSEPEDGRAAVRIHESLCVQFGREARAAFGELFAGRVRSRFSGVIADLGDALGDGVTREAALARTGVVTLHLSRADIWVAPKVSTVDAFLPITLTLMVTNAASGEVVFSETLSVITGGPMSSNSYVVELQAALPERLAAHIHALVDQAAARFRPYPIQATVRRGAGDGVYVIDVGRRGGVGEGDTFGADAEVIFAGDDYAVIRPVLGELRDGQRLERFVARPLEALGRTRVIVVADARGSGAPEALLTTIAEDALAESPVITIVPVNTAHALIRGQTLGGFGVAYRLRELPDYFLRVSAAVLDPSEVPTNVRNVRRRSYQAWAFLELVDHNGRIAFAASGSAEISEDIVGDMGFSDDQRRETALRNAVIRAAAALNADFRPQRRTLDISGGDSATVEDETGSLSPGLRGVALRRSGGYWLPVGEVMVDAVSGASAALRSTGLEPYTARRGDRFAFEAAGPGYASRERLAPCRDAEGAALVDVRGPVSQPLYGRIARIGFAAGFRGTVLADDFAAALRARLETQFAGLETLGAVAPNAATLCFVPVHQVVPIDDERGDAGRRYDVTMGFQVRRNGERVAGSGLQNRLTATATPEAANPQQRLNQLQMDLAEEAARRTSEAAANLSITP